ncbi:NDMA-dependent alcohol dehydrogenase [Pseudonocardia sp. RS010]|uniref:NDMA-dependent alcohol dehydrogenase n=1 Tax=Pseudonocardia sp. RS010 TaxID=3385979 RepID=UPI0039A1CCEA
MRSRAAVLTGKSRDWELVEVELDPPKQGEVLIKFVAAGLCHSDEHSRRGEFQPRLPMIGGHEGAGIIEEVGPGVVGLEPGDHVVCSFIPSCGSCRYCSTGRQNLCDLGAFALEGCMPDGTFRAHGDGQDYGRMCLVGSFAQYGVLSQHSVVKVPEHLPLEVAVLVGCGVPTGWGAAINAGEVRPGDTAVVYGIGGIGINAVQGARVAGARHVVAVDPLQYKRDTALKLGATHAVGSAEEAQELITRLTWGQGADQSIVTVGVLEEEVVRSAFDVLGKGGVEVIIGLSSPEAVNIKVPGFFLVNWERQIRGSLFGSSNPQYDIRRMLALYEDGIVKLDELVTARYTLDEVNQGYADLEAGKNIRGIIVHEH